jgi:hypothetical protein
MQIVYKLTSGAVLAAAQSQDGDQIINPTPAQVFSGFNPSLHGNLVLNSGFPADLSSNPRQYQVTPIPTPTAVIPKYHILVQTFASSLPADGTTEIAISLSILDASNAVVNTARTLNLSCSAGFLSQAQIATVAGVATLVYTTGL